MLSSRKREVQRTLSRALLALGIAALLSNGRAQLVTLNETFTGTSMSSGWTAAAASGTTYTPILTAASGIDPTGSGWLRLTDANNYEATSVRDTNAFNSANATIAVKFNYAAYGGTGADGTTFFLADGSIPAQNFQTGAYGGSLGYANFNANGTLISGMTGGYLGMGLDEYGNYATMNEGKNGGFGTSTNLNAYPNAVSIRGPGAGQTGYAYLGGTAPFTPPFAFPSDTTRPTGTEARTFEIIITATNQVTVYMQAGATAQLLPIFSADLSGYARPDQLIMGFTGSTGGLNDIHEIQGLSLASQAATLWTHGAGTTAWGTASNWNGYGGTIPALGSDVLLDNHYVSSAQTIDLGGTNQSIRSLQIDAPFSYTVGNGTLEFNSQGILGPVGIFASQGNGAAAHTVNTNITADENIEVKNLSTGTLTLGGNVALGSNTATLDGTGTTAISGVVSGTGAIVKNDSGTVSLTGNNTFSGGAALNAGTLSVGNNNALGTGGVTLNGGTLASSASNTVANTLTLQGNAGLSNITTSGTLTQTGGNFTLNMAGATHSGIVNLSNDNTNRTLTIDVDSGTSTVSGVIQNGGTGTGSLTKTGIGTLTLSGANTYTGTTTISGGTIQLGANDVLANTSAMNIGASAALNLNGFSQKIGNLQAAGGATINFGSGTTANTLIFGNYTAPTSGVLVITNWSGTNGDKLATTVGSQTVSSIYFSGQGVAQEATSQTAMGGTYGSAYLLTPVAVTPIEWSGTSSSSWGTSSNWTKGTVPGTTDIALFDATGKNRPTTTLNRAFTIAGIKFGNTAGNTSAAYTINGTRTLTLTGAVPYIQQQNDYQNQTISVSSLALGNSTVMDITGAKNLIISAPISNVTGVNAAIIKDGVGAGKLVLSGANTFTGGVFINNGTVQAANGSALGNATASTTISDGATLELTGGITVANPISVTGAGVGGGGAISNVGGNNTLSGTITETGATTIAAASGTALTLSNTLTGTNQDTTFSGAGNINAALITTGTGNVTMNGTGTLTYTGGNNTYTGTTTVNSGTLVLNKTAGNVGIAGNLVIGDGVGAAGSTTVRLSSSNQISTTSGVTINSDGVLNLNGASNTIANISGSGVLDNTNATTASTLTVGDTSSKTFSGSIQDTGANLSLVKVGTGKLTLSGNNTYAGGTTVNGGIVAIQSNTALGNGTLAVNSGGKLEVSGGITVANLMTLAGNGTAANDGAIQSTAGSNLLTGAITLGNATRIQSESGSTLTVSGNIAGTGMALDLGGAGNITITGNIGTSTGGTLTKDGSGYVILNPTANGSNYTGLTTISDGTLEIQKSSALGTSAGGVTVASGGTLAVSGNITTAESPITLSGAGDNNTGALRNVSGANTVSGAITLNGATSIDSDSGTLTTSGVIAGTAGNDLTKVGAGTVAFTGTSANTFAGNLTVANGTLILNKTAGLNAAGTGSVTIGDASGGTNSAILQLGANSQMATTTAVTLNGDGKFDLNGKTQTIGSIADGASGQGTVTLGGGTLTVGNANNTSFSGTVSGAGSVVKTGTGTLTLTQGATNGSFAPGTLTVSAGTVQLGAGNIIGTASTLNLNGGTLAIGGAFNQTIGNLTLSLSSSIDFQNNTSALTFTNVTRTGGTLTISNWAGNPLGGGNSNLIFTNAATGFTGGTVINEITFTGYAAGAVRLAGGEIVPNTGGTFYTWNSTTGGNWNSTGNWSPTGSPGNIGDTAILGNAISGPATISLNGADRTLGYLTLDSSNNYTVTGNNLIFDVNAGAAQVINNNTGSSTIASGMKLNDALTITQNGTGTLLISGGITNGGATSENITVAGAGSMNISGNITTGTGSLTKNGTGTLTLGGTNTYSGGTTINGGTVAISNDNNLGATTGALSINGGTLENTGAVTLNSSRTLTVGASGATFQTDGNLSYSGVIAGTGKITKTGTATLTSGGTSANTNTGNVAINAGTLELAKSAAVTALADSADINVAGGATLKFNGTGAYTAETIGSLEGAGTVNNASANTLTLTTGGNNASTTFSGSIQNSGGALSLTKTGTGTFTLSGANSYTGATTVSQGILNIQNSTALGATTGGTTVASGASLQLQGGISVGAEALTMSGNGVLASNDGVLRNISGTNSFAGAITLGAASTIRSDTGTLTLSGAIGGSGMGLTLAGPGNITVSGAIGTGTGTVTKNDSGYDIFSGNNTYTGATAINAGTLEIQSANALGGTGGATTVASGATLALGGAGITFSADPVTLNGIGVNSLGALRNVSGSNTYSGNITLASASVVGTDAGTTLNVTGLISGTASLAKVGDGTLILNHANTYSGGTTVTQGTLQISSDGNLGSTSSALTLNGGTLNTTSTMSLVSTRGLALGPSGGTINTNSGTTLTVAGVVSGTSGGALNKTGSGTLVLSTTNTYNGPTNLNGGNVSISNDANLGGTGGAINFNGGGLLSTATLTTNRAITVGAAGGSLNVANATTLTFGGSMSGSGNLAVNLNTSGTLTFNSTINFSAGSLTLSGGTMSLAGVNVSLGTLHITGNTVLDFGNSTASILNVGTFTVDAGVTVTVTNWVNMVDYFYATTFTNAVPDTRNSTPENQITFTTPTSYPSSNTTWESWDHEITPAPEPATYGVIFLAGCLGVLVWRRRARRSPAQL